MYRGQVAAFEEVLLLQVRRSKRQRRNGKVGGWKRKGIDKVDGAWRGGDKGDENEGTTKRIVVLEMISFSHEMEKKEDEVEEDGWGMHLISYYPLFRCIQRPVFSSILISPEEH